MGKGLTGLWIDTPIRTKVNIPRVRRPAISVKRHRINPNDSHATPLVLLVRHPERALISNRNGTFHEPGAMEHSAEKFIEMCQVVDAWEGPVSMLYYEDFISTDPGVVSAAIAQLMRAMNVHDFEPALQEFIKNLPEHSKRSHYALERRPQSHTIDWDSKDVHGAIQIIQQELNRARKTSPTLALIQGHYQKAG